MAKHLAASGKQKRQERQDKRLQALPKLTDIRPGKRKKNYDREFTIPRIVPVLIAATLFLVGNLLRVPLWIKVVIFGLAALVAGFELFKRSLVTALNGKLPDEDLLILLAAVLAFCIEEYSAAALAVILYRAAELVQAYVLARSDRAIDQLRSILPETARVEAEYGPVDTVPEAVQIGDILQVGPGEVIPLDGVVLEGISAVDCSPLTGGTESRAITAGSEVHSGCLNLNAPIRIEVKRSFEDSAAAMLVTSFSVAGKHASRTEKRLNKYAAYYTPALFILSLVVGILPAIFNGNWNAGLHRAVVLLLISSPSAVLISVPLAYVGALVCSARNGILVAGKNRVEKLSRVGTMVFGKTGTLTEGIYTVTDVFPDGVSERALLSVAAAAESHSRHPIARALKQAAGWTGEMGEGVMQVEEIPGRGVSAFIEGKHVYVGNAALLDEHGIWYRVPTRAGAAIHVAVENRYWGHVLVSDKIRDGAFDALEDLRAQGVENMVMLTGDVLSVTRPIASSLSFDMVKAELTPEGKLSAIDYLLRGKGERSTLAYVGDGINDEEMFDRADLGIAINALENLESLEDADIAVLDGDISALPKARKIATAAHWIALQNIILVCAVKLILLVLGIAGILPISLTAVLDMAAAVLATLNALRSFIMIV